MDARPSLHLTRAQILSFRKSVQFLDERLPRGTTSLRGAAWAGLQDSMPRAAILSIHARVEGTTSVVLEDPSLVQVWGPRFSAYVVSARDVAPFTLGRLPDSPPRRKRTEDTAARLHAFLDGREMTDGEAGRGIGVHPNSLRYAAPTGTVLIRWDGARAPTVRTVPPPQVAPQESSPRAGLALPARLWTGHRRRLRAVGRHQGRRGPRQLRGARRGADRGQHSRRRRLDPGHR